MQTFLTRRATVAERKSPRRSPSFMSLRREKDCDSSPSATPSRTPSRSPVPSVPRLRPSPGTSSEPSPVEPDAWLDSPVAFPSVEPPSHTPIYLRNRSQTDPNTNFRRVDKPSVPDLRLSGASSHHTESPLHTPIDDSDPSGVDSLDNFSILVAAPASGVETMDALVDGMNGGDFMIADNAFSSNKKFNVPHHHPLYQPPLPTPPPGVVLGGGKARRPKRSSKQTRPRTSYSDDEDEDYGPSSDKLSRNRRPQQRRPSTAQPDSPVRSNGWSSSSRRWEDDELYSDKQKTVVPSISDIIRAHAPPDGQRRSTPAPASRNSSYAHSIGQSTLHEEQEYEYNDKPKEEDGELVSRSSIDSVADEILRTLKVQSTLQPSANTTQSHPHSNRHSMLPTDSASINSPRSDGGAGSIYSSSVASSLSPSVPLDDMNMLAALKTSQTQEVAQYLRSARLTSLMKLTRAPHASVESPLTVSFSDMGNPAGFPVVIFLGLGCVRHLMGLYDEMADCLNLRLIAIDRWGLGRTEQRPKASKGILQWTSIVEEVLDMLEIEKCSIMAHSAGAPYALSFGNRFPERVVGDLSLLAPWVGGSEQGGYKWLKYVPTGVLKTAQAAEWKLQAWMIGKPPTVAFEGIGYTKAESKSPPIRLPEDKFGAVYPFLNSKPRPSIGSSTFSEYDDLRDFDGRFESRSTLGPSNLSPPHGARASSETKLISPKRKVSRGFLDRLKGSGTTSPSPPPPPEDKSPGQRRLKGLRSMSSLKGKPSIRKTLEQTSPTLPLPDKFETGLGLDDVTWSKTISIANPATYGEAYSQSGDDILKGGVSSRSERRRSVSLTNSGRRPAMSLPSSPTGSSSYQPSFVGQPPSINSNSFQAALGNALIAASHSESSRGTHSDLLQILNHDNKPWGFSYADYPHRVKVWYGDKDEKIAEHAVRWMERTMGPDRCSVKVVAGADHGLMYKSSVVVEVLETIADVWKSDS